MLIAQYLKIFGQVQGVYYRASMLAQAKQKGIVGWVKNCPDGTVEACVIGPATTIDDLVSWCWQGSSAAKVVNITITSIATPTPLPTQFIIT